MLNTTSGICHLYFFFENWPINLLIY
jgi:hypothetical protein